MHQKEGTLYLGFRSPEMRPLNPCIALDSARRDPCFHLLLSLQNEALMTSCLAMGALANVIVADARVDDCSGALENAALRSRSVSW